MAGRRARGANALMSLGLNSAAYGAISAPGGYYKMPFVEADLGEQQPLLEPDLLGQGREPLTPDLDVANDDGNATVPVDLRYFPLWLLLMLGEPTTAQGVAAKGLYFFDAQPANNSVLTVNGQAITFVTAAPANANQVHIGATLAETIANAVKVLNASAVADVAEASYRANLNGDSIEITYDVVGTAGNAFTIVAGSSPDTNATASGATLAGGSASGPYNHVFTSGALDLPDGVVEIGFPEVPSYGLNRGTMVNTMSISAQRQGHLNARLGLIAQGEDRSPTPIDATPIELLIERFSQWSGALYLDGAPAADLVSFEFNFNNNLDKVETIRADGRIGAVDAGNLTVGINIGARFKDTSILDKATSQVPVEIELGWRIAAGKTLTFRTPLVFLPKPKLPVSGPGGVQANFTAQAAKGPGGHALYVTVVNDVAAYELP